MCIVTQHRLFDSSVHQVEMEYPEAREAIASLKWELERGAELGVYVHELDVYRVTLEQIQVFYSKSDPLGEPTQIVLLTARLRPDSG